MKPFSLLSLIILFMFILSINSQVKIIDSLEQLEQEQTKGKYVIVYFCSKNYDLCELVNGQYASISKEYSNFKDIVFAQSSIGSQIADTYQIDDILLWKVFHEKDTVITISRNVPQVRKFIINLINENNFIKTIETNEELKHEQMNEKYVVVYFCSPYHKTCSQITDSQYSGLIKSFKNVDNIVFTKTSMGREISSSLNIEEIPQWKVFNQGKEVFTSLKNVPKLRSFLDSVKSE